MNVKKQKRDEGVQQAIQKKKVEAKTQKKKEETSSSEESDLSSSDSDVKVYYTIYCLFSYFFCILLCWLMYCWLFDYFFTYELKCLNKV